MRIANYELLHRDREMVEARRPAARARGSTWSSWTRPSESRIAAAATSQAVCALPRRRGWALTGTPVENGPQDLVGIFEFLAPGLLSPDLKPGEIGRTIRDYVLRRTKERVLKELPPKLFCDADLSLTPQQEETYRLARDEGSCG